MDTAVEQQNWLAVAWRWLMDIPRMRWLWWPMLVINFFGSLYGFYWYWDQLRVTPVYYWPLVPDSPTASSLFVIMLALYLARKRLRWLEAIGYTMLIKYGFWTVLVLGHYMIQSHTMPLLLLMLIVSHAGMAAEAMIFARRFLLDWTSWLIAAAWVIFDDLMDYTPVNLHAYLPNPANEWLARDVAIGLTIFALGYLLWVNDWFERSSEAL